MTFEIGTPYNKINNDCFECAKKIADDLMKEGTKVYIRDTEKNKIVYGNYFKWSNQDE